MVRDMSTSADEPAQRRTMRAPCPRCGCTDGTITTKGGQDTVRCAQCDRYCYNAPRRETGREPRVLRTRPQIRPSQRARILMRDNWACVMCHRTDVDLDAGHLVSDHDGRLLGMSEAELQGDDNLAAMCSVCNSGWSDQTVPPRLVAAAIMAQQRRGAGRSESA